LGKGSVTDAVTLTKDGYSILRKIVNGKNAKKLLVVTFDSEAYPITEFDLHSSECDVLVNQRLAEYIESESTPDKNRYWDEMVIFPDPLVSAKIIPTNLGEFALEQYDKNEKRFRRSEFRSWLAVGISVIALIISILI